MELYTYDASGPVPTVALKKTIFSESRQDASSGKPQIRQFRPIPDLNGRAMMWTRGWYNNAVFTDFNMDLKLYRLDGEAVTNEERLAEMEERLHSLLSSLNP